MRYAKNIRPVSVLLLLTFLIGCTAMIGLSSSATGPAPGSAPVRLRLKVENSTLRPGQVTRVSAQFLDRNYQPVPTDGTRTVEFGTIGQGSISPPRVTVRPGAPSADATFTAAAQGKVVITARTSGLDPAQTMVVIIRPTASLLSRLFDTVAYADSYEGFELNAEKSDVVANLLERAAFKVAFSDVPPTGTKIRIKVSPPAVLICHNKELGTVTDINFPANEALLPDVIEIKSRRVGQVEVKAIVLPHGPEFVLPLNFIAPKPYQVSFGEETVEIGPHKKEARVSLRLEDQSYIMVAPDKPRSVLLKSEGPVEFYPDRITLSPQRPAAETTIRLKAFPANGQLELRAEDQSEEDTLVFGKKLVTIQSAVDKVKFWGPPHELTRGNTPTELTVGLVDKNGILTTADWERKIELHANTGKLTPTQVTIPSGQNLARVQYQPSGSAGKAVISATSPSLPEATLEISLVTAWYWLVTFALIGGLIGGAARLMPAGDKLERILPRWTTDNLGLLAGRLAGSIVSGLFLYLALKLGLSQVLGVTSLPAGFNFGTGLAAFFFGGLGGFAGTVVLDRLVSRLLPGSLPQTAQTA